MRVEALYDQGTVRISEDRFYVPPSPFSVGLVGVADGVSGLYVPSEGPILFEGQSGGQMAAEILVQTLANAGSDVPLEEILLRANSKIYTAQTHLGFYHRNEVEYLGGSTFSVAQIGTEEIEIIQCGDCFALWVTNKEIGITKNQVFHHDTEATRIIATLMEKHGGDREKMWQEFRPILAKMRQRNVNKEGGYSLLNGQPEVQKFWQRFFLFRSEIKLLLLFTDGLIYYPDSGDEHALAQKVIRLYNESGLRTILAETRRKEAKEKQKSHIDHAEASAVAIKF